MPNNNKKTRGSQQSNVSQQTNPGVGHGGSNHSGSDDRSNRGNADRNQGMGDHGSSRRTENVSNDRSSGK